MQGLYTYCVGKKGMTGRSIDLEVVPYRDIAAVVSTVSLQDFEGPKAQKLLENEQWLKEKVLAHEQVVEEMMRRTPPIVPFKFGTIFRNRAKLLAMLKDQYARFRLLLERLQDKQEWGVKLFSNLNLLVPVIRRTNPESRRCIQKMKGKPAGKKYFLEKEFEAQLKERVVERQHARADNLERQLSALCEQCVHNPVLPQTLTGRGEEMILNAALLVKGAAVPQLQQIITQWNRTHSKEGFSAELTGPWPPYNFATL